MLVIPLQYNRETIGVLKIILKKPSAFDATDKAVMDMLADVLAAEIQFANKYCDDSLYYLATHDQMTGLYNRSMFFDKLRNEIIRTEREGVEFGVMMLDMDGLKTINDTYGQVMQRSVRSPNASTPQYVNLIRQLAWVEMSLGYCCSQHMGWLSWMI